MLQATGFRLGLSISIACRGDRKMKPLLFNLGLSLVLFASAWSVSARATKKARAWVFAISIPVCFPAITYSLYYFHFFDDWQLFYQFRSFQAANYYPSLLGWLLGWSFGIFSSIRVRFYQSVVAVICLVVPFAKPVLFPPDLSKFEDSWHDGICFQTSYFSCGPASVATLLKQQFNDQVSEREIAASALTSRSGTEVWYLAQILRKRGYSVYFHTRCPTPMESSVAGTKIFGVGHFVAVLGPNAQQCTIADPLSGLKPINNLKGMQLTGFYMQVRKLT